MTATRQDLSSWFDMGVTDGATHMIVMHDTFDHDNYPVYVMPGEDPREIEAKTLTESEMQDVDEVYALWKPKAPQMALRRVWDYDMPPATKAPDEDVEAEADEYCRWCDSQSGCPEHDGTHQVMPVPCCPYCDHIAEHTGGGLGICLVSGCGCDGSEPRPLAEAIAELHSEEDAMSDPEWLRHVAMTPANKKRLERIIARLGDS